MVVVGRFWKVRSFFVCLSSGGRGAWGARRRFEAVGRRCGRVRRFIFLLLVAGALGAPAGIWGLWFSVFGGFGGFFLFF